MVIAPLLYNTLIWLTTGIFSGKFRNKESAEWTIVIMGICWCEQAFTDLCRIVEVHHIKFFIRYVAAICRNQMSGLKSSQILTRGNV